MPCAAVRCREPISAANETETHITDHTAVDFITVTVKIIRQKSITSLS